MHKKNMNVHIDCLVAAAKNLNIPHTYIDTDQLFLRLDTRKGPQYFIGNETPFNSAITARIADDKGYTYQLVSNYVRMPKTLAFVDPNTKEEYKEYIHEKSLNDMVQKSEATFGYPMITKKNSGSQGEHVFLCHNREELTKNLITIFDKSTPAYDYVALVQECIKIKKEYRVVVFDGQIELLYHKDNSQAEYTGNLSPLHWDGALAVVETDLAVFERIQAFIDPLFKLIDLRFGGLDIAIDHEDRLCLFELNYKPGFNYFVTHNSSDRLVELYSKMLKKEYVD